MSELKAKKTQAQPSCFIPKTKTPKPHQTSHTEVTGQKFDGETLAPPKPKALDRQARNIAPIQKPKSQGALFEQLELEKKQSAPQAPKPSPAGKSSFTTPSFLTPKGKFADSCEDALAPLDPKSENWNKPLDIKALSKETITTPKPRVSGLNAVQRKTKFVQVSTQGADSRDKMDQIMDVIDSLTAESAAITEVPGLVPKLLPHQQTGVAFLCNRELPKKLVPEDCAIPGGKGSGVSGGFLCDDMGLGKTVQSIALILNNRRDKDAKGPKSTLVVVPLAVMAQWRDEIKTKAPCLTVTTHQGASRSDSAKELHQYDVAITTYDVVAAENKRGGPLFEKPWYRIIADEAHVFRNPGTALSQAMAALKSDGRRWVLTGTPLHNSTEDLFSLFRFVQVKPYDDIAAWRSDFGKASAAPTVAKLLGGILQALMLRRRQSVIGAILPTCTKHKVPVTLSAEETAVYEKISELSKKVWLGALDDSTPLVVYILRLRQTANDLSLLQSDEKWAKIAGTGLESASAVPAKEPPAKLPAKPSGNPAAKDPSDASDEGLDDLVAGLGAIDLRPSQGAKTKMGSKVAGVVDVLLREPHRKTVIFSSFVTMLEVVAKALKEEGLSYRLYTGSTDSKDREEMLSDFKRTDKFTVLLCSLQTASVGLNITAASRVVFCEPWWNPMITDQAVNRVHRLGQDKPVDIYEMVAMNTLERRIFTIQDKKRGLAENILEKNEKLSPEEIKYLLFG